MDTPAEAEVDMGIAKAFALGLLLAGCEGPVTRADASTDAAVFYDVAPSGTQDPALVGNWGDTGTTLSFAADGTGSYTRHVAECDQTASTTFVWSTEGATLRFVLTSPCSVTQAPSCSPSQTPNCNIVSPDVAWSIGGDGGATLTLDRNDGPGTAVLPRLP